MEKDSIISRINRETGTDEFVSMEFAVEKIVGHYHNKPTDADRSAIREKLNLGVTLNTSFFLYELIREGESCG